jgi:uncharacterized protein YaaW (UPF0174 family)
VAVTPPPLAKTDWKIIRALLEVCKYKDILIQQEFNNIGKESDYYTRKENDIYSKGITCEHTGQLLTL